MAYDAISYCPQVAAMCEPYTEWVSTADCYKDLIRIAGNGETSDGTVFRMVSRQVCPARPACGDPHR